MDPEIVFYAIGGVCALIVAIMGGRSVGRRAGGVTEDVDPNAQLVSMLDRANKRIDRLEADNAHGKVRMSDVEQELATEREHSRGQDEQIGRLHRENQQQREQLSILRRALEGWEAWHRLLIAKWDELRVHDDPPEAPQVADNTTD